MTAFVAVLQLLQQMAVDLSPLSWKPGVGDVNVVHVLRHVIGGPLRN